MAVFAKALVAVSARDALIQGRVEPGGVRDRQKKSKNHTEYPRELHFPTAEVTIALGTGLPGNTTVRRRTASESEIPDAPPSQAHALSKRPGRSLSIDRS